jgi:predicted unusual protein kinase regulating ubiquinone biosynthesis (AarF/ABC1/UbiB family)
MLMEGVGKKLEPDMDLLRAAVPFLSQAIKLRIRNVL